MDTERGSVTYDYTEEHRFWSPPPGSATSLGKFVNLSVPQFPHLLNQDANSTYRTRFVWELHGLVHMECSEPTLACINVTAIS